jgi:hypothetical protein
MRRYLAYTDPKLMARAQDVEDCGKFSIKTIRPRQRCVLRFLEPSWADPATEYVLDIVSHIWPGKGDIESNPLHATSICPKLTHPMLLESPSDRCPACDAGVEIKHAVLAYAIEEGPKKGGVLIKFNPQNLSVLNNLLEDGVFDLAKGCKVELWADEGWRLHYRCLEDDPVDSDEYSLLTSLPGMGPKPLKLKSNLASIAETRHGWIKAGRPMPGDRRWGCALDLADGPLKNCILVPIPWGLKSPVDMGWQTVGSEMMYDGDYRLRLCLGNAGLLCGKDQWAVDHERRPFTPRAPRRRALPGRVARSPDN